MTIGQVTPNKLPVASGSGLAAAAPAADAPPATIPAKACPTVADHNLLGASMAAALESLEVAQPKVDLEAVACPESQDEANRGGRPSTNTSSSTEVG